MSRDHNAVVQQPSETSNAGHVADILETWGYNWKDALDRANVYVLENYSEFKPLTIQSVLDGVCSTNTTQNPRLYPDRETYLAYERALIEEETT